MIIKLQEKRKKEGYKKDLEKNKTIKKIAIGTYIYQ